MYNLHSLNWKSFQELCHTVIRENLGQTVESFLDSHDGGRDGAFSGEWTSVGQEDLNGPLVIQCKFTSLANYSLKISDLSDDISKVKRLVDEGICRSYVLMTNAGVSGDREKEIVKLLKATGVEHVRILGSTWIIQQIRENNRLRMLVPRVYGLGDLSQVLDDRAYEQAQSILESIQEDLAKVVITDAYRRSVAAIGEHNFVLLKGEPGAGKTTVASLLSKKARDQSEASILKLDSPDEIAKHWNPNERLQFFWLDDAFGVMQYEKSRVESWNHALPRIQAILNSGAKIVMTSRDYIYNRARNDLKGSAFPLLNESQVVINVHDLSLHEKEQILYNHISLGNQTHRFRTEIEPHLPAIASHPRFIPEIARRLGDSFFTEDFLIDGRNVDLFVEKHEEFLLEILRGLDTDSRAALALIYMRTGKLESPIQPREIESIALQRLGSSFAGCVSALNAFRDSLVRLTSTNDERVWQFSHPTIGDAYAKTLAQNPEHIDILIQGTEPERLLGQITCGEVGLENAVVVPKALFLQVTGKLRQLRQSNLFKTKSYSASKAKSNLHSFLAYRCSSEFLSLYLEHDSVLLDEVCKPGLALSIVPEVSLAKRLHELGLLPDRHRKKFVHAVCDYAVDGQDASALDDESVQSLFTEDELRELVRRIRSETLPRLDEIRSECEDLLFLEPISPEEQMQQFFEFCDSLLSQFGDDQDTVELIRQQESIAWDWISESEI